MPEGDLQNGGSHTPTAVSGCHRHPFDHGHGGRGFPHVRVSLDVHGQRGQQRLLGGVKGFDKVGRVQVMVLVCGKKNQASSVLRLSTVRTILSTLTLQIGDKARKK